MLVYRFVCCRVCSLLFISNFAADLSCSAIIYGLPGKDAFSDLFIVKLHEKSRHVFRLDVYNEKYHLQQILSALAKNSTDPAFLGYPYGLIEADKFSRISNQEKDFLKTKLLSKLKNENINRLLNTINAHNILDNIS